MPNPIQLDPKKWRTILTLLTLITIFCIVIIIKIYVLVPVPTPADTGIPLVVEDEHWAAWMPIDNGFTYEPNKAYDYWNGVLIQLGRYWERDGGEILFFAGFDKMVIDGSAGSKTLNKGDFDWINIVSSRPGVTPPITPDYVGLLWPDAGTPTQCKPIDDCVDPYTGTPKPCVCEMPPCEEGVLEPIPPECLRLRSVHSHFLPEALITYWQGANGYKVVALPEAHGGEHNRYTFLMQDAVELAAYKEGTNLSLNVGELKKITVYGVDIIDHGEIHDPGLDGGKIGPP